MSRRFLPLGPLGRGVHRGRPFNELVRQLPMGAGTLTYHK
jgi:hypothetical protein